MAFSFEVAMPTYVIYRDFQAGQLAGAAPLVFDPPKGSDELFFALQSKYPHLKNTSERIRAAVFEFLREEEALLDSALAQSQPLTPEMADAASITTSHYPAIFPPAISSSQSTWSSPEMHSVPTSTFGDSPPPLSRQFSVATTATVPSESR